MEISEEEEELNRIYNLPLKEVESLSEEEEELSDKFQTWSDEEKWLHVLRLRYHLETKDTEIRGRERYLWDKINPMNSGMSFTLEGALKDWHYKKKYWNYLLGYTVLSLTFIFFSCC